mgnify:FL=1|jgi:hypothetical protein
MTKRRKPWLRTLLAIILIMVVAGAIVYWYVATEKFSDTKDRKAVFTVSALDFIREFQQDEKKANDKYVNKIVTVNGRVSEIEAVDTTVNIKFVDPNSSSYAIFRFQEQHIAETKNLQVGDSVSIKGSCSGSIYSEILDAYSIDFKRCTLNN